MGKISVFDCTLRDGGYVNDFGFGESEVRGYLSLIEKTNVEYCEIGFIRPDAIDSPHRNIFSCTESVNRLIQNKSSHMKYVSMIDMSNPVNLDRVQKYDGTGLDTIRVIFKKDKILEGIHYCKEIMEKGYEVFAQLVCTDRYLDSELVDTINLLNEINPHVVSIVDTFGVVEKKQFLKMADILDKYLNPDIALGYHGHNNLKQAMGNAVGLIELNLERDIVIDACILGMGRGAGNLNLEIIADYLNNECGTEYLVNPMLEIADLYLKDSFNNKFLGYSLPMYISARAGVHPNYAIFLSNRGEFTADVYREILESIPEGKKTIYSEENAEYYYQKYLNKT